MYIEQLPIRPIKISHVARSGFPPVLQGRCYEPQEARSCNILQPKTDAHRAFPLLTPENTKATIFRSFPTPSFVAPTEKVAPPLAEQLCCDGVIRPAHQCIRSVVTQEELVKHFALFALLLLLALPGLAQTYSNSNLNGTYAVQFGFPQNYTWSKKFTCPTNSRVTYTATNSQTTTAVGYGAVTFDGNGNYTVSITNIGQLDATSSANTMSVTWSSTCHVTKVNYGQLIYLSPTNQQSTGTYSVESNGTGTIIQQGTSGQYLTFVLAGTNSSGISTTAVLTNNQVNGSSIGTGIAVLQ